MKPIVSVKNLRKSYDKREVVKGISFDVQKGEIFGILGPNGAGKTTTLEMIETMRPIEGGTVKLDGIDVAKSPEDIKRRIGVQLQSSAFMDKLTLIELLGLFAATYGVSIDPAVLLEEVQLTDKAKSIYKTLSGGQKQRFSIATTLVNDPKVLFLDEPTTGLDPQARRNLWELIQSIQKKGVTIIITTHYMEEAEVLCERIAIMDNGEIVALDSPKNLVKKLLARGFTKPQHVEQASLEDVFIDLTGKDLRE
jgi:ABC-2 type transport system ATP-binding protein